MKHIRTCLIGTTVLIGSSALARAGIDPNSGIDFVRIGAVGNAPWMGDGSPSDRAIGRGQVNYEYHIGRFEVTTAQWTEFFNAALDRPSNDRLPHVIAPSFWGAVPTSPINGGQRFRVPTGNEMRPVGNISWRMAAMYCNWLHNGKGTNREAFMNGAYDVSTFFYIGNIFQDQVTHNANARYWIPTLDEWIKAVHYDPNRFGPDQGGYWREGNSSNVRSEPGPPGIGRANYGFSTPSPFNIPLGAYPSVQSPWGLLDTAGGTAEWTEYIFPNFGQNTDRGFDGSYWTGTGSAADTIYSWGGDFPSLSTFDLGFRIASSVPSPGSCIVLGGVLSIWCSARRRRRNHVDIKVGCFDHPSDGHSNFFTRSSHWRYSQRLVERRNNVPCRQLSDRCYDRLFFRGCHSSHFPSWRKQRTPNK